MSNRNGSPTPTFIFFIGIAVVTIAFVAMVNNEPAKDVIEMMKQCSAGDKAACKVVYDE